MQDSNKRIYDGITKIKLFLISKASGDPCLTYNIPFILHHVPVHWPFSIGLFVIIVVFLSLILSSPIQFSDDAVLCAAGKIELEIQGRACTLYYSFQSSTILWSALQWTLLSFTHEILMGRRWAFTLLEERWVPSVWVFVLGGAGSKPHSPQSMKLLYGHHKNCNIDPFYNKKNTANMSAF